MAWTPKCGGLDSSRVDIQTIHNSSILVSIILWPRCESHMYAAGGPWSVDWAIQARTALSNTICVQLSTTQGCCNMNIPFGHSPWLPFLPSTEYRVIKYREPFCNLSSIFHAYLSWRSNWSRIWSGQPIYLNDLVQIQWKESGCRARIRIQLFFDKDYKHSSVFTAL